MTSAVAQEQTAEAFDPVYLFNEVCYTKLPDIKKIEDMAVELAWKSIRGENLSKFSPVDNPDVLKGWDMLLDQRIFRIGVVQSPPTDELIAQYPDFETATSTSCTLILDGYDDGAQTLAHMDALMRKEATGREVPNEGLLTTHWQGGNENILVFVFYQSDSAGSANFISVTLVEK